MSEAQRILVSIDPTAVEHPSVDRAMQLARALDAKLELFICDHDPYFSGHAVMTLSGADEARATLLETHVKHLERLAQDAAERGIETEIEARWDYPASDGIIRKVLESNPDLVVKDTVFHGPIRRTLFTSTDWELIRQCPAPLLLTKAAARADSAPIIAAVDPMHEHAKPAALDDRILDMAEGLSKALRAELHVFHAVPAWQLGSSMGGPASGALPPMDESVRRELEGTHRAALDQLLKGRPIDAGFIEMQTGAPAELLIGLAEKLGAGIVVTGAVSRGLLKRAVVGNTAEHVLDRLGCDLLIVKAPKAFAPS